MTTGSQFGAVSAAAGVVAAAVALAAVPALAGQEPDPAAVAAAEARAEAAGERLGADIQRAIRSGGPFFTAAERNVIERACNYPA
ncbi:hypothetical protein, partial [Allosphingosinicella sp.]|uniref:hypothetical protein n=1 Tax=Allosphingosinicella sp. TaxID=2823234 RepID=UPI002EE77263